jgi:hypothetical protein
MVHDAIPCQSFFPFLTTHSFQVLVSKSNLAEHTQSFECRGIYPSHTFTYASHAHLSHLSRLSRSALFVAYIYVSPSIAPWMYYTREIAHTTNTHPSVRPQHTVPSTCASPSLYIHTILVAPTPFRTHTTKLSSLLSLYKLFIARGYEGLVPYCWPYTYGSLSGLTHTTARYLF